MRKKTKQPLDAANLINAWDALFKAEQVLSKEQLNKDGWLDVYEIAERLNIGHRSACERMKKLKAEHKKFSILWSDGKTRSVNFFRLK
jgi:hypothetical protein